MVNAIAHTTGLKAGSQQNLSFLKKAEIHLISAQKLLKFVQSIKSRLQPAGRFRSEGAIHLLQWHPPV